MHSTGLWSLFQNTIIMHVLGSSTGRGFCKTGTHFTFDPLSFASVLHMNTNNIGSLNLYAAHCPFSKDFHGSCSVRYDLALPPSGSRGVGGEMHHGPAPPSIYTSNLRCSGGDSPEVRYRNLCLDKVLD